MYDIMYLYSTSHIMDVFSGNFEGDFFIYFLLGDGRVLDNIRVCQVGKCTK